MILLFTLYQLSDIVILNYKEMSCVKITDNIGGSHKKASQENLI